MTPDAASRERAANARSGFTIPELRAWADDKRHILACCHLRRGFWPGEQLDHDVLVSMVNLLDRLAGDSVVLARLKRPGSNG